MDGREADPTLVRRREALQFRDPVLDHGQACGRRRFSSTSSRIRNREPFASSAVNAGYMRVVKRGKNLRLALESRHSLGVVGQSCRKALDRDVPSQLACAR